MHEVHVDVIGVQALERCVELTQDRIGTAAVNALAVLDVGAVLRGDQNLVADTLDSLANDLLGVALAVDGGGIDQVDAAIDHGLDCLDGVLVVNLAVAAAHAVLAADGPRTDGDSRDLLAGFFHCLVTHC